MAFSLLLPLFVVFAHVYRRAVLVKAALLLASIGAGTLLGSHPLRYLPVFGLGVLMAYHADALAAAADWLRRRSRPGWVWGGLAAATGILLCGRWEAAGLPYRSALTEAAGSAATIVGAVLAVFLAMHWPGARDLLDRRITQWLGRRSFSLYLIHGPVLVSLAFLLPAALAPIVVLGLGPWLALVVAAVFYRLVEAPAHRASQAVGRRVAPAARRSTPRVSLMPVEVGRARDGDRA